MKTGGWSRFYDGDPCLPVVQQTKQNQHYSVEVLAKLLVANPISKEKIRTKQPLRVCQSVSCVVDLHSLDDPYNIRADENGMWKRKGSPVAHVSIHTVKSGEKSSSTQELVITHITTS